eukprot:TRINITY_DN10421_c0_g1_i2.p2 TRINITY_DN10421_c0_g1~~TRINITY_DN10421_c0_g1_i2.p2  ORF type:complete len:188 (+),score=57.64 TRINITY_DN10421_c0_g1_i2:122-685(+)
MCIRDRYQRRVRGELPVAMAYRDHEREERAIKKLAQIEKMGDFVTRQKILAERAWTKKKQCQATDLQETAEMSGEMTDEERLMLLVERMEERHRREVRELQLAVHDLRADLGDNSQFCKNHFGSITDEIDDIGVEWDEDCARMARNMEARHAEEMAALEQEMLAVQNEMYRKGLQGGKGRRIATHAI